MIKRIIFATFALAGACCAQAPGLFETMAPQRGIVPYGTYSVDKIETINSTSGALGLKIPLATLAAGRAGFASGLDLVYNSDIYDVGYEFDPTLFGSVLTLQNSLWGGWQYSYTYDLEIDSIVGSDGLGSSGCPNPDNTANTVNYYNKLSLITPDHSHHTLLQVPSDGGDNSNGNGYYAVEPTGASGGPCYPFGSFSAQTRTYFTSDGTYLRLVFSSDPANGPTWLDQPWTLYFPDGRQVSGIGGHATRIQDANGNGIDINQTLQDCLYDSGPCNGGANVSVQTALEDDFGRQIAIQHQVSGGVAIADTITQPGVGGGTMTSTVNFVNVAESGTYSLGSWQATPAYPNPATVQSWGWAISEVDLPTVNGYTPKYQFGYCSPGCPTGWGEVHLVTLPSGATIRYDYALDGGGARAVNLLTANPVVKKTVTQSSPYSTTDVWQYCYSQYGYQFPTAGCAFSAPSPWNCSSNCTVVQDPAGGYTRHDYFDPGGNTNRGLVFKTTYADGSTDETQWWNNRPYQTGANDMANPYARARVRSIASSGSPTQVTTQVSTLDKNGNELTSQEYDWAAYSGITHGSLGDVTGLNLGVLDRTKTSAFVATTATQADQGVYCSTCTMYDDPSAYWHAGGPLHYDLPSNSYASGAGLGSAVAYAYDGNAYGASLSGAGSPTSEWHWDSTKGAALSTFLSSPASSNATVTTRVFDQTYKGNLLSVTDPKGNSTSYTYDATNHLYMTAITQAGLRNFTLLHDFNTGLLTYITDTDNSVTSSYSYDPVGRVVAATEGSTSGAAMYSNNSAGSPVVASAGLRNTTYTYQDATLTLVTAADENALNDGLIVNSTTFDGCAT